MLFSQKEIISEEICLFQQTVMASKEIRNVYVFIHKQENCNIKFMFFFTLSNNNSNVIPKLPVLLNKGN